MATSTPANIRPRVVVIGAGFGGIYAAKALGKLPVDVTVVDRKNHHTFQPLLYQVALAVLSPGEIAQPIRTILRDNTNTEVIMDEVVGLDIRERRVHLKSGAELLYDFLIVGTGSTHSYFGKEEWAKLAPGLKSIEDATEIRRRVLLAFELAERQTLETGTHPPLNFVIIGGGPTGVELAGAISDIARLYMTRTSVISIPPPRTSSSWKDRRTFSPPTPRTCSRRLWTTRKARCARPHRISRHRCTAGLRDGWRRAH